MRKVMVFLAIISVVYMPTVAGALDVGLTPSHVYSLWVNINTAILSVGKFVGGEGIAKNSISAIKPGKFTGKTPGNVLALSLEVESLIDGLRITSDLPPTRGLDVGSENTTPSDVFLVSSRVLISGVELIIRKTEADHLISPYFSHHIFDGKTPSDVYALVDLAHRRLLAIEKKIIEAEATGMAEMP